MKPGEVTLLPVNNIERNPHNPRRLFDDEPMKILLESIKQVGVLVPITVYPDIDTNDVDPEKDTFNILDGERRWRCAILLKMQTIPAIILERPTEVHNILQMFHIHNIREPWMLMPTALKLKVLMQRLGETNEKNLAELTKLSISQVRRCKTLLTYDKKYQEMLLSSPSERISADFFIDLQRIRGPALEEKMPFWAKRGDNKCIDIILTKYRDGIIKSVTEPRKIASIYRGSVKAKKLDIFYEEMDKFLDNPSMTVNEIIVPGAGFEREYQEIKRSAKRLQNQLKKLDVGAISSDQAMINILTELSELIQSRLEQALVTRPVDVRNISK